MLIDNAVRELETTDAEGRHHERDAHLLVGAGLQGSMLYEHPTRCCCAIDKGTARRILEFFGVVLDRIVGHLLHCSIRGWSYRMRAGLTASPPESTSTNSGTWR